MVVAATPSERARAATPPLLEALDEVLVRRSRDYPAVDAPSRRRAAGVLALFYERAGEMHLVFFKRTEKVPTHKGQVAFPGGSGETGDPDLAATALREAQEELGIDPSRGVRRGAQSPFDNFVGNFVVRPFDGNRVDCEPNFTP